MKLLPQATYWLFCIILLFSSVFAGITINAQAQPGPEETPPPVLLSPNTIYQRYLPAVVKMNNIDLGYGGIEITQGIQTQTNTIPLIAGRATVIRFFVASNKSPAGNVRISLTARRGGTTLAGSPLIVGPGTVPTSYSRANLATSFNATLPSAWTSGLVTITATLDSTNAVKEMNEANNVANFNLNFIAMPALDIKVVPITFTDPDSGITYPAASTGYLDDGILRLYPLSTVRVSVRTGITVSCDLDYESCWSNVLDRITSLKSADKAPASQVYFGMIPLEDDRGGTWFFGGIAGVGWVGNRSSVGLTNSSDWGINGGEVAAHEIGHNLGRLHAPCGGPSGVDRNYPYRGASIGEYGLNINRMLLLTPDVYTDIMGYCEDKWISDYTYRALQGVLVNNPATAMENRDSLLVRAALDGDTISQVEPAYTFNGNPAPADANSEYQIEFLDENGRMVDSYPLQVLEADEPGIRIRRINSLAPLPDNPFASYRITRFGVALAENRLELAQPDSLALQPAAILAGDTLQISWQDASTPALVRYSTDGGQSWTTLGLDVLGGSLSVPRNELPQGNLTIEIILAGRSIAPMTINWTNPQ